MVNMTKPHTTAALAAKQIKAELKTAFPAAKFSVTSANFGCGGDSVDIRWSGQPLREQVREITDKYEEGTWNGLTDNYDRTNIRKDISQVVFIRMQRRDQDTGKISRD